MRSGRLLALAAMLTVLAALTPIPAAASLWLIFEPERGLPGSTIHARTGGDGALVNIKGVTLPVYLAPESSVDDLQRQTDPRLVRLANLAVDGSANGHLSFVVPNIPPGHYAAVLWCEACAPYSGGRSLLPVGRFEVISSEPPAGSAPSPLLPRSGCGCARRHHLAP